MKRTMVTIGLCALLCLATACGGSSKKDAVATGSTDKPSETVDTAVSTTSTSAASGSSTTTAAPSTTASTVVSGASGATDAEFVAQANALCAKFDGQIAAVAQPTETTPAALGAYLDQALTLLDQQIGELKALSPPASISTAWAKILQSIDAEQVQIEALIPRLKSGDATALTAMQAISSDDINAQFDALGMTTCGSGSGG